MSSSRKKLTTLLVRCLRLDSDGIFSIIPYLILLFLTELIFMRSKILIPWLISRQYQCQPFRVKENTILNGWLIPYPGDISVELLYSVGKRSILIQKRLLRRPKPMKTIQKTTKEGASPRGEEKVEPFRPGRGRAGRRAPRGKPRASRAWRRAPRRGPRARRDGGGGRRPQTRVPRRGRQGRWRWSCGPRLAARRGRQAAPTAPPRADRSRAAWPPLPSDFLTPYPLDSPPRFPFVSAGTDWNNPITGTNSRTRRRKRRFLNTQKVVETICADGYLVFLWDWVHGREGMDWNRIGWEGLYGSRPIWHPEVDIS